MIAEAAGQPFTLPVGTFARYTVRITGRAPAPTDVERPRVIKEAVKQARSDGFKVEDVVQATPQTDDGWLVELAVREKAVR